jgi:hypothetical protein
MTGIDLELPEGVPEMGQSEQLAFFDAPTLWL